MLSNEETIWLLLQLALPLSERMRYKQDTQIMEVYCFYKEFKNTKGKKREKINSQKPFTMNDIISHFWLAKIKTSTTNKKIAQIVQ